MRKIALLFIALCILALSGRAMAYSISLTPASQTIGVGQSATAHVNLSVTGQEQLFGFNFGLAYDPAVLSFNNLAFGPALSGYLTGFTPPSAGSGLVTFDGALDLFSTTGLTAGTYKLASVFFEGIGQGTSPLALSGEVLDMDPQANLVPLRADASVTVPEPGMMLLFGLGVAGLFRSVVRTPKAARG